MVGFRVAGAERPSLIALEGERRLRERGALRLTAIVADDEEGAMAFWGAAGYQRQPQRARFVRHTDLALGEDETGDAPGALDVNEART